MDTAMTMTRGQPDTSASVLGGKTATISCGGSGNIFDGWDPSSTHFWNADNGDVLASDLEGTLLKQHFLFTVPKAYQKFLAYANGGWTMIWGQK